MFDTLERLLQSALNLSPEVQANLLRSLVVLFALWFLRLLAVRTVDRQFKSDGRALYTWRKAISYITVLLGLIVVGRIWISGVQTLTTYLGLVSAGVAIALQDLIVNFAGWIFIIWRRPFVRGDRIQIGDHAGDVIDVRVFEFSLLEIGNWVDSDQSTGRVIHVPNGKVFRDIFANYSQGLPYIWHEVPIMLTFESNWEKAKQLLVQIVNEYAPQVDELVEERVRSANRRFVISYANITPTVYTRVAESGVVLTLRYLVDPRQRRDAEQTIWEEVLRSFAKHWDIDFAYETQRKYDHLLEGPKPPAADPSDANSTLSSETN